MTALGSETRTILRRGHRISLSSGGRLCRCRLIAVAIEFFFLDDATHGRRQDIGVGDFLSAAFVATAFGSGFSFGFGRS